MSSSLRELKSSIGPVGNRLHGIPPEQQAENLKKERKDLRWEISGMVNPVQKVPLFGFLTQGAIAYTGGILGLTTFDWAQYVDNPPNCNAHIADKNRSEKKVYDMVMETGRRLRKAGSSEISRESNKFHQVITSVSDADNLAEAISSFCYCLPAISTGNVALLDKNDVKLVLLQVIKSVVNNGSTTHSLRVEKEFVIDRPGHYCYVHYNFVSDTSIQEACCVKSKIVDFEVTKSFFNVREDQI